MIAINTQKPELFDNRALLRLLLPLILEQLLLITVGMADTVMVSTVGEAAVSGISLVDQINNLLIQLFAALASGGAVVAAQYIGRRDRENACDSAKQLIYASFFISVIVMAAALIFNNQIIDAIYGKIDVNVRQNAQIYFYLTALSFPSLAVYNAGAALFRAKGNSRISLYMSVIMNIINIGGNAILIYGFNMGTAGAGIATLLSRTVTAATILWMLAKPDEVMYIADIFRYKFKPDMIRSILKIGIPNGIENSIFHLGRLLVAGLITSFGTAAIAANAVCGSICAIPAIPGGAIGLALVTVVGQCMGAGEIEQAEKYTKKLMVLSYIASFAMNMFLIIFAGQIIGIYNISPQAQEISQEIVKCFAIGSIIFWPMAFVLPNALRAAGDVKFVMIVSMISMWTLRIGFSYVLGLWLNWGVLGTWVAMILDWVLRAAMFYWRFHRGKWKTFKVV